MFGIVEAFLISSISFLVLEIWSGYAQYLMGLHLLDLLKARRGPQRVEL